MVDNIEREKEVKILDIDIEKIEYKLVKLGAEKISEEKQINTLIDSYEKPIKEQVDGYLRIREVEDIMNKEESKLLTLKKNIKNKYVRDNLEMTVKIDNKNVMLEILKDLGFNKIDVGYKLRKSYKFYNTRIDLDIWDKKTYPYPYMEVEFKNIDDLYQVLDILEIDRGKISTKSIKQLKDELSK